MARGSRSALLAAIALAVSFAAARSAFLAGLVPPFHGPDEPAHFDYVQRLAEHGRLPIPVSRCDAYSAESRALADAWMWPVATRSDLPLPAPGSYAPPEATSAARATTGCGPAASYPPLYYATAAIAYDAVRTESFLERLLAARMTSVAWGCAGAVAAVLLGFFLFGTIPDALLIAALVLLQPMIGFVSSVVNNDAALFAVATGVAAAIAALHRRPDRARTAMVAIAALSVAGTLVKPTFVIYLPAVFGFTAAARGPRALRSWIAAGLTVLPAGIATLAWSILARASTADLIAAAAKPMPFAEWWKARFTLRMLDAIWVQQYWMSWNWLDTRLAPGYYVAIEAALALVAVGITWGWRCLSTRDRGLVVATALATVIALSALYSLDFIVARNTGNSFAQGRYLLPLFPAHAAVVVVGLRALAARLRVALDAPWTFVLLLAVVHAAAALRTVERFHA